MYKINSTKNILNKWMDIFCEEHQSETLQNIIIFMNFQTKIEKVKAAL